jgi:hypothetical protein
MELSMQHHEEEGLHLGFQNHNAGDASTVNV